LFKKLTYSWEALKKLVEYEGEFQKFKEQEKHFLSALSEGHIAYADIIRVLIENHDNKAAATHLFEQHPRLHKVIPKQYDNTSQVIEVLLEYIKTFQWHLEHFSMDFHGEIEKSLGGKSEDEKLYVSKD
jgi:hypothetical protein